MVGLIFLVVLKPVSSVGYTALILVVAPSIYLVNSGSKKVMWTITILS